MHRRRFTIGPLARRLAGLAIGLIAAMITVVAVSMLTLGRQFDVIVPLMVFIVLGSAAASLRKRVR